MKVLIEIRAGADHRHHVTKNDMQRNIDAFDRAIQGNSLSTDGTLLLDTKSILEGIQSQLGE